MKRKFDPASIKKKPALVKSKRMSLVNPPPRRHGPEKKNNDFSSQATVVAATATATILTLNAMTQGTAPTNYLGRSVIMKSIAWIFTGALAATSAGGSPLRVLIVYDKQTNAALPATTQIVVNDRIDTFMNLANSKRFIVVADQQVQSVGTQGPQGWYIHGYRKMNLPMEFNTTNGGTIADIQTGAMYALIWQDGKIITADPINSFNCRIRFEDA